MISILMCRVMGVNAHTTATGGLDFISLTAKATGQKIAWMREAAGDRLADIELNLVCVAITITGGHLRPAEEVLPRLFAPRILNSLRIY
jgi:hypothetical protein